MGRLVLFAHPHCDFHLFEAVIVVGVEVVVAASAVAVAVAVAIALPSAEPCDWPALLVVPIALIW